MKKISNINPGLQLTVIAIILITFSSSCSQQSDFYSMDDFPIVRKIDAHFHYNVLDTEVLEYAKSYNFKIITPNTRTIEDNQFQVASTLWKAYPDQLAFFGTFKAEDWDQPWFVEQTIGRIDEVVEAGARGIKIWKNIGMVIQDSAGRYLMADDPVFEFIFDYLEESQIPVLGHFGEPLNCWLPFDEMSVKSNRDYYLKNPQYHMYQHPEAPSYKAHLEARDHVLERHPNLIFIGAHMASLEWDVNELATWFERFPNTTVDMAGRINHLQHQTIADFQKVRDFMIQYQDRLLYATDRSIRPQHDDVDAIKHSLLDKWESEWVFLATDSVFVSPQVYQSVVTGLHLPRTVIDKIYYSNAAWIFN